MKTVFIVSGAHEGETRFASNVADDVALRLRNEGHKVVRVPFDYTDRRELSRGPSKQFQDLDSAGVYALLKKAGFKKKDASHVVLDFHENPLNFKETFPNEYAWFVKDFKHCVDESFKDGHRGVYFAEVRGPQDYEDIRSMPRKKIGLLGESKARFLRIEVPVWGVFSSRRTVQANEEKTLREIERRANEKFESKKELESKIGALVHSLLKL